MKFKIDREFHSELRRLTDRELAGLEAQILEDGCKDALVIWNGLLVDGHNRFEICQKHNLPFKTVEWEFEDRAHALRWIRQTHKGRRNLSDIDLIELTQRDVRPAIASKAKENQSKTSVDAPRNAKGQLQPVLPILAKPVNTLAECAKEAGVGKTTYAKGCEILEARREGKVDEATIEALRTRQTTINAVIREIGQKEKREQRAVKRRQASKNLSMDVRITVGDFRRYAHKVPDGSLAMIFTDPPYDRESSKMLPALAEFAAAKLAEGGSMICYVGQTQLPAALDAFRLHLRYWWTCACVHSGAKNLMKEYGVRAHWKPMLWFVKTTRDDPSAIVEDLVSGGEEKSDHEWQQAESEAAYWIEKLCPKDGIVCDPFLGSGTTGLAADSLNRQWIGFEIDAKTATKASERVNA